MVQSASDWNNKHLYKVRDQRQPVVVDTPEPDSLRGEIEPWLTALLQSEHLSLLVGSGFSTAAHWLAKNTSGAGMEQLDFSVFKEQIDKSSIVSAERSGRGTANIEDQIRICNELIRGLEIYISTNVYGSGKIRKELDKLKSELGSGLSSFANNILLSENNIINSADNELAAECLMSFLVSFSSRSATRERLNLFTTNYDRIIEYGAELAGVRLIDRFVGSINPIFRSSRVDVDMHYNPPGIRGEPRYLEGVVHFTKLHGSLDWTAQDGVIKRFALPYGASDIRTYSNKTEQRNLMIYPNSTKDRETAEYPYVELFRDLAASTCRPNSTVFIYGYSFGDEHINRVLIDMLSIPSTHLVIISFDDESGRVKRFYDGVKRPAQISLMVGKHFGDLKTLIDNYLPKPAIDRTTIKMADLLKSRGLAQPPITQNEDGNGI
jgi:SIR2-like protein